ncbi:MAG: metallophosphoesterase family protein [Candidatus Thorarchaeota archaeon]
MTLRIIIVGDTHASSFQEIPKEILEYSRDANLIIHTGDFIGESVLEGFQILKKNCFIGVYGNADNLKIRNKLKSKEIIQISKIRIGITHPYFGGPDSSIVTKVLKMFIQDNTQIIIFGHTHDPNVIVKNHIILINPGKGYVDNHSVNPKASIALLEIGNKLNVRIVQIEN